MAWTKNSISCYDFRPTGDSSFTARLRALPTKHRALKRTLPPPRRSQTPLLDKVRRGPAARGGFSKKAASLTTNIFFLTGCYETFGVETTEPLGEVQGEEARCWLNPTCRRGVHARLEGGEGSRARGERAECERHKGSAAALTRTMPKKTQKAPLSSFQRPPPLPLTSSC